MNFRRASPLLRAAQIILFDCKSLTVTWNRYVLDSAPEIRNLFAMEILPEELKAKIIKSLNLQDITPAQIDNVRAALWRGAGWNWIRLTRSNSS